jgi:hypothetical protein
MKARFLKLKFIISLLIIIVFLGIGSYLNYKSSSNSRETSTKKATNTQSSYKSNKSDPKINLLVKSIYKDFKKYSNNAILDLKIGNINHDSYRKILDKLTEDLFWTSDKGYALTKKFNNYLSKEEKQYVKSQMRKIYSYRIGSFWTINSGYSKTGIHFIAISTPSFDDSSGSYFEKLADKLRGKDGELELIAGDSIYKRNNLAYYYVDLYTEDLTKPKGDSSKYKIDIESIDDSVERKTNKPIYGYKRNRASICKQNNRKYYYDKNVVNNTWRLYFYDGGPSYPIVRIKYKGEIINLVNISCWV